MSTKSLDLRTATSVNLNNPHSNSTSIYQEKFSLMRNYIIKWLAERKHTIQIPENLENARELPSHLIETLEKIPTLQVTLKQNKELIEGLKNNKSEEDSEIFKKIGTLVDIIAKKEIEDAKDVLIISFIFAALAIGFAVFFSLNCPDLVALVIGDIILGTGIILLLAITCYSINSIYQAKKINKITP